MANRFTLPFADVGSGITPEDGAKLFFFDTGTSNPKNTFSDKAGTTPNTNPVIANANGVFSDIFTDGNYKVRLTDKNDVQIWEADPVNAVATDNSVVKSFPTLALAVSNINLVDGDALNIIERTTGNGGGAFWDVVLSSTVTENTFNIVQCTGVATLSLVLRSGDEINLKQYGGTGDGTTDDDGAVTKFFMDISAGSAGFIPNGTYLFNTEVVVTGRRFTIACDADANLQWNGITAADAITFGDGGTTITQNGVVRGLTVLDNANPGGAAIDALVALDACHRSAFYDLVTRGNNHVSGGAGLVFRGEAWINEFFKYGSFFTNIGIQYDNGCLVYATSFYGVALENQGEAGVNVITGAVLNTVAHFGGTIEAIDGPGMLFDAPPGISLYSVYFEACVGGSITETHTSPGNSIIVQACTFDGTVASVNAHITVTSPTDYYVSHCRYEQAPLIDLNNVAAKVVLESNPVNGSHAEVVETLSSKWVDFGLDGNGFYEINTGTGVAQLDQSNVVNEARLGLTTGAALVNSTDSFTLQEWYEEHEATVNITAFAGGGQTNAVLLTTEINEVDTAATTGDSVKLPISSERLGYTGIKRTIINEGANAIDVFPGTGNDIGAGTNVAVSLAAGANITYVNYSAILWTALS